MQVVIKDLVVVS